MLHRRVGWQIIKQLRSSTQAHIIGSDSGTNKMDDRDINTNVTPLESLVRAYRQHFSASVMRRGQQNFLWASISYFLCRSYIW